MSGERSLWGFFDLGWTLEDESPAQIDRASQTVRLLEGHGISLSPEDFLQRLQDAGTAGADRVFDRVLVQLGLTDRQLSEVRADVRWNTDHLVLYPDAVPALTALHGTARLGIIANQSPGSEERLVHHGVRHFFDVVFASAEVGLAKPDSRIFEMAEKHTGVSPDNIWMIGDRPDNDIAPARKRGWHTVRVLRGHHAYCAAEHPSDTAEYEVRSLHEIPGLLSATD